MKLLRAWAASGSRAGGELAEDATVHSGVARFRGFASFKSWQIRVPPKWAVVLACGIIDLLTFIHGTELPP